MSDDSLVAALARAQANFGPIGKGHTNDHFRSKYADIADVLAIVRPVLAAEGIAVSQPTRITEHGCELVTVLLKGSERMESAFPMPTNLKPQDTLSWLTYLRRGQLCSMLGIHPSGEDDDGNGAQASQPVTKRTKVTTSSKPREQAPIPDGEVLSFDQLVEVREFFDGMPDDVRKARKQQFKARFGDPQTVGADQWPDVQAFMTEEPFG
jgi:hypothetical protein